MVSSSYWRRVVRRRKDARRTSEDGAALVDMELPIRTSPHHDGAVLVVVRLESKRQSMSPDQEVSRKRLFP
jgi:hypothetical protein